MYSSNFAVPFRHFSSARLGILALVPTSTFLPLQYPLCTIGLRSTVRDSLSWQDVALKHVASQRPVALFEGDDMMDAFQPWIGQAVVLQVALGDIKVPLRGKLLKDGDDTVRMRIGDGWDVDIYKAMIMGVEEDRLALLPA
jgi:hypothetical protein